jgi:hypothetical protein
MAGCAVCAQDAQQSNNACLSPLVDVPDAMSGACYLSAANFLWKLRYLSSDKYG